MYLASRLASGATPPCFLTAPYRRLPHLAGVLTDNTHMAADSTRAAVHNRSAAPERNRVAAGSTPEAADNKLEVEVHTAAHHRARPARDQAQRLDPTSHRHGHRANRRHASLRHASHHRHGRHANRHWPGILLIRGPARWQSSVLFYALSPSSKLRVWRNTMTVAFSRSDRKAGYHSSSGGISSVSALQRRYSMTVFVPRTRRHSIRSSQYVTPRSRTGYQANHRRQGVKGAPAKATTYFEFSRPSYERKPPGLVHFAYR